MDYSRYDVEDFVADPFFSRWVKRPDDETKAFWEKWMADHPERSATIAQAKSILQFLLFQLNEARQEESHSVEPGSVEQREAKTYILRQINASPRGRVHLPRRYLSIAAAASLLLIGAYVIWYFGGNPFYQQYTTSYGEQQEIILPDSTRITLNANSGLKYKRGWNPELAREVWLEGEAFFEVVKQPEAADGRFIVHTPQLNVEVLGTSFNVQTRHGETQVVLNTGKVKLQPTGPARTEQTVFLEPGEMATLSQDRLVKAQVDPKKYLSWKDNRIFFDNERIRKIAQWLTDTYGYEVEVDNPEWLDYTFTGSCPADDVSILLVALTESFDFEVTRRDGRIYIQRHESIGDSL